MEVCESTSAAVSNWRGVMKCDQPDNQNGPEFPDSMIWILPAMPSRVNLKNRVKKLADETSRFQMKSACGSKAAHPRIKGR